MEMWAAKLKKYEKGAVAFLTVLVGLIHSLSYIFKTEKCHYCNNFVDSFWVEVFHKTNYAFWWLLFYAVIIRGQRKYSFVYFFGMAISEFLLVNEIVGNGKDWGASDIFIFVLVLFLSWKRFGSCY